MRKKIIRTSIALTILLLIISFAIVILMFEDRKIAGLLATFCVLNVAETFLSILLLVSTLTEERNNKLALELLIFELKSRGKIDTDFTTQVSDIFK